jgi:hypothetical protein
VSTEGLGYSELPAAPPAAGSLRAAGLSLALRARVRVKLTVFGPECASVPVRRGRRGYILNLSVTEPRVRSRSVPARARRDGGAAAADWELNAAAGRARAAPGRGHWQPGPA